MNSFRIGCTAIIIALFIVRANSIKCFVCSSYEHPECGDSESLKKSMNFVEECKPVDNNTMFCRKTVQTVKDTPRFTRITRSCGWYVYKKNESNCRESDSDFKLETSCQCFTDLCNSVITPMEIPLTLLLLLSTSIVVLMVY